MRVTQLVLIAASKSSFKLAESKNVMNTIRTGLIRGELERLTVPDAVASVHLEVESIEEAEARQGDLFDRGFASAGAGEAALARLIEEQGPVVVAPSPVDGRPPPRPLPRADVEPLQTGERGPEPAPGSGCRDAKAPRPPSRPATPPRSGSPSKGPRAPARRSSRSRESPARRRR